MKKVVYIIGLCIFLAGNYSCSDDHLNEKPLDFFSPENSYVTADDYQKAINELYRQVRWICYCDAEYKVYLTGTDMAHDGRYQLTARFGGHTNYLVPTNGDVYRHWNNWYKVSANANTIISRVQETDLTDGEKDLITAEAKFFRAFAYRFLVYLWGGVPLVTEEATSPKTDYVRASKEEVLSQIAADALDAANGLPKITEVVDGKISNLVAYHLLAETYISLGRYDDAIIAASEVINDPNTGLMTQRFGSMANEDPHDELLKFTQPGDPYWDLFRRSNQDRSSGNKESLWNIKFVPDVQGGNQSSGGIPGNVGNSDAGYGSGLLERHAGPVAWMLFLDPDGNAGTLGLPESSYNSGGAGVAQMRNTDYYLYDLWQDDWDNDIRNAPHNIVRDFIYNNPASAYYGKSAIGEFKSPTWESQIWRWWPYPTKITTPGQHPDECYVDKEKNQIKSTCGSTYRDHYMMRLAETYLIRAEAYLGKGDLQNAANDINMVRSRAKAKPVAPANVNIDYILDERGRELTYEEPRRITLHRVGKHVERVRRCNTLNRDEIQDHHGLWPIPYAEIERNKDAVLEQNPGYVN